MPEDASIGAAVDRRAGNWSWPLIVASVLLIGGSVNWFGPDAPVAESETSDPVEAETSFADLAILKIQAQVVIAAGAFAPTETQTSLAQLRDMAVDDHSKAAVALVTRFVGGEDSTDEALEIVEEISDESPATVLRRALEDGVGDEERYVLERSLGWFAKLAPSPDGGEAPEAAEIRDRSVLVLLVGGTVFTGALCMIAIGAIFLFLAVRKQREAGGVFAFQAAAVPRGVMLECFAVYLGIMALGELAGLAFSRWGGDVFGSLGGVVFTFGIYGSAVVVPLLWPLFRGTKWSDFRRSIGLHRGRGAWREVGAGFLGYAGVIAIASVGVFCTLMLTLLVGLYSMMTGDPGSGPDGAALGPGAEAGPQTHPIVGWIYAGGWAERLLCLFLAAVFAPVFEEIFFRGALHRYLRGRWRFFGSALLASVVFAALHPQGWVGIPALASMGIGFAVLREWRDSLIAPMVAHALNNGILVLVLFLVV